MGIYECWMARAIENGYFSKGLNIFTGHKSTLWSSNNHDIYLYVDDGIQLSLFSYWESVFQPVSIWSNEKHIRERSLEYKFGTLVNITDWSVFDCRHDENEPLSTTHMSYIDMMVRDAISRISKLYGTIVDHDTFVKNGCPRIYMKAINNLDYFESKFGFEHSLDRDILNDIRAKEFKLYTDDLDRVYSISEIHELFGGSYIFLSMDHDSKFSTFKNMETDTGNPFKVGAVYPHNDSSLSSELASIWGLPTSLPRNIIGDWHE